MNEDAEKKEIKKYKNILLIFAILSGLIVLTTISKIIRTNPEYIYTIITLPIISFICLYALYRHMSTVTFLKTITYWLIIICTIYIMFFFIGFVSCSGYNSKMAICSAMPSNCSELPKQRIICNFIREDKSILKYIFGYYMYISIFFVSLISTLVTKINIQPKTIHNKFIYTKAIFLIILILIVIFFPKIYNLITGVDLFNI